MLGPAEEGAHLESHGVSGEGLNVLLTHERFPPDFAGGGERFVLDIARNLIRRKVAVTVLTTGDPKITAYQGVPTIRLPIHRYAFNLAVPQIIARSRHVHLIHTFNYHACLPSLVAGRWLGKPVVCTFLGIVQDVWTETHGALSGRARVLWERFLLTRRFARMQFLSEENLRIATRLGVRPECAEVNLLGLPADIGPAPQKEREVLFVGKFDARKGVYDVLETARALPEIRFRLLTWPSPAEEVFQTAPSNVEFIVQPDRAVVREAFGKAAIFLLPSRGEGFPLALAEAMASGCAIVASFPTEFAGIRVTAGDRPAMVEGVRFLWANAAEVERMGRRNVELAGNFSWDRHMDRLLLTYRQALEECSGNTMEGNARR